MVPCVMRSRCGGMAVTWCAVSIKASTVSEERTQTVYVLSRPFRKTWKGGGRCGVGSVEGCAGWQPGAATSAMVELEGCAGAATTWAKIVSEKKFSGSRMFSIRVGLGLSLFWLAVSAVQRCWHVPVRVGVWEDVGLCARWRKSVTGARAAALGVWLAFVELVVVCARREGGPVVAAEIAFGGGILLVFQGSRSFRHCLKSNSQLSLLSSRYIPVGSSLSGFIAAELMSFTPFRGKRGATDSVPASAGEAGLGVSPRSNLPLANSHGEWGPTQGANSVSSLLGSMGCYSQGPDSLVKRKV